MHESRGPLGNTAFGILIKRSHSKGLEAIGIDGLVGKKENLQGTCGPGHYLRKSAEKAADDSSAPCVPPSYCSLETLRKD